MTLNRSLFFTTVGLLFVILLIPLFVANNLFFPFITGKNFAFRIIVELAALSWVILILRDKDYRPKFSWLSLAITAFVVIVGIADIFGSNPVKSFLSNYERMEGWITIAHLLLYFIILGSILRTWKFWKRFFQTSVAVSAIVCIHGFLQLAGKAEIHQSVSRLDASFGNAEYLAIYMLFHVFVTGILLFRHVKDSSVRDDGYRNFWYKDWIVYMYSLMIILQAVVLFYTATRGSILGLIGGLVMSAILVAITEKEYRFLRKFSVWVLVAIAVLIGVFFLTKNTAFVQKNEVLSRLASISATDNTTMARYLIWNMSWKGATQDPKHFIIGWGQESFNYVFNKYYNPAMYAQEQWFDRAHDVVFDWLTAAGVLGLLSYLSIFVLTLYSIWKKSNFSTLEKSLITGMLAGYFFHNIFVFDNIVSYVLFFSVLAYVHSSSIASVVPVKQNSNHGKNNRAQEVQLNSWLQYTGMVLAVAIFIVVFYRYDYKPIAANLSLINALTETQVAPSSASSTPVYIYTEGNVDSFKKALSYNTTGLYEVREQLMDIASKTVNSSSDNKVKQDFVALTESEINNQLKETPNDVRYYVLGGSFYQNIGDYKDAEPLLLKAAQLSPKKQSVLFALGSNYFGLGKNDQALAIFKEAYDLDTSFGEAKNLYALVAVYVGQNKIATDLFGAGPIMDPRFLAAYKTTKNYDLMIAYLEKAVAKNPTDLQSRVSLAAGYMTVGNISKAIATLQAIKPITTNPNVLAEIDALIKDIRAGNNPFETGTL